jgi:hypothetical protein
MKLYTETEILSLLKIHLADEEQADSFVALLTPIELPSDEEIWNEGKLVFDEKGKTIYTHYNTVPSWTEGAKWMRDKIVQGGSHE